MKFQTALSCVLSLTLVTSSIVPAYAQGSSAAPAFSMPKIDPSDVILSNIPGWTDFSKGQWQPFKIGPFMKNDPMLDQDPYFLRTQSWKSSSAKASRTMVAANGKSVDIQASGSNLILHIDQPLKPLIEADDYIFLQATSPDFFKAKAADDESYGEGLFFIDTRDLRAESLRQKGERHGVPVFFLPLGGSGWTQNIISAVAGDDNDVIAFRNIEGEGISLEFSDLDQLSKYYHFNLVMAVCSYLRHEPDLVRNKIMASMQSDPNGQVELPYALPPKGSTAVFGTFLTGLDLDHPDRSITKIAGRFNFDLDFLGAILPKAYASFLTPDVFEKLMIVGSAVGVTLIGSLAAKYSVLKKRMTDIRSYLESVDDKRREEQGLPVVDRTTWAYKAKTKAVDTLTISSQAFAVQEFLPTVSLGYLFEYGVDRFFGRQGSSPNGLLRRFINWSIMFDRSNSQNVNANAWTLWLGSVVLGGVDTGLVIPQLLVLNPIFLPFVGGLISTELGQQMTQQYSGHDPVTANILTSEIFRNITGYTIHGSYSYAQEMVAMFETAERPKVEEQMRREGKNPQDVAWKPELERRVKAALEPKLVERGLPSEKEHLFDATGWIQKFMKRRGYGVDRTKLKTEDLKSDPHFILEYARWGTLKKVLKLMVNEAKRMQETAPSETMNNVVKYATELQSDFNETLNSLKHPFSPTMVAEKAKSVRQMLSAMSYLDTTPVFDSKVKYLNVWKGYTEDPEAGAISARIFRQALFSVLDDKPYYLRPNEQQMEKYGEQALAEADVVLQGKGVAYNEGDKKLLSIEIVKEKIAAEERRISLENYRPPIPSWRKMDFGMVRRQQLRMQARAIEQVAKQLNREPKEFHDNPDLLAEPEVKQLYEDAYQAAYLNEVKLYTLPEQYSKLVQAASQQAVEAVEVGMQNEQLSTYFRKLSAGDQAKMMAHMKAELFVDKYVKLTESSSEYVPLTSPEQPGRLQKWRMYGKLPNQPGRIGSLVNGTLRALEAPFRLTYGMGAEAWRHRTIPFAADATAAVKNKAKRLFLLMGASYWVNYYVWQTTFTWPQYLFLTGTFTLLSVAAYALDRMMMNIDKAPMDSTKRKIVYSIFWSTISFPLGFPFYFWAKPFTASWDKYVTTPIATALNTVVTTPIEHVITACEKLLGN